MDGLVSSLETADVSLAPHRIHHCGQARVPHGLVGILKGKTGAARLVADDPSVGEIDFVTYIRIHSPSQDDRVPVARSAIQLESRCGDRRMLSFEEFMGERDETTEDRPQIIGGAVSARNISTGAILFRFCCRRESERIGCSIAVTRRSGSNH